MRVHVYCTYKPAEGRRRRRKGKEALSQSPALSHTCVRKKKKKREGNLSDPPLCYCPIGLAVQGIAQSEHWQQGSVRLGLFVFEEASSLPRQRPTVYRVPCTVCVTNKGQENRMLLDTALAYLQVQTQTHTKRARHGRQQAQKRNQELQNEPTSTPFMTLRAIYEYSTVHTKPERTLLARPYNKEDCDPGVNAQAASRRCGNHTIRVTDRTHRPIKTRCSSHPCIPRSILLLRLC